MVELDKVFSECRAFIHCLDAKVRAQPAVDERKAPTKKTGIVVLLTQIRPELFAGQRHINLTYLEFDCKTVLFGNKPSHIIEQSPGRPTAVPREGR